MLDKELAIRIAMVALLREFERICDEGCKNPKYNKAYREAIELMEVKDEPL